MFDGSLCKIGVPGEIRSKSGVAEAAGTVFK